MDIRHAFVTAIAVSFLLGGPRVIGTTLKTRQVPLAFEVASIKPTATKPDFNSFRSSFHCRASDSKYSDDTIQSAPPLGHCLIRNMTFLEIFRGAYTVPSDDYLKNEIKGNLAWLNERLDIDAKAENPASTSMQQLMQMCQTLLVDRFKLKFHLEPRDVQGFELIAAGRPKLEDTGTEEGESIGNTHEPSGKAVTAHNAKMARIVTTISNVANAPVNDKTGLSGHYSFTLTWAGRDQTSFFTVLQEQLGLRLVPQKVPIEIYVIDSAQKP